MEFKNFLQKNKWYLSIAFIGLALLFIFILIVKNNISIPVVNEVASVDDTKDLKEDLAQIGAQSFIVYDINSGKSLFEKDPHKQLPLASITKLMTGLVVLNKLPNSTIVEIGSNSIRQEGDSGLFVGEKWKLKELLDFSLITSSNDGISALASVLDAYESIDNKNTLKLMNEKATELALKDTIFINETGLDIDKKISGAYSSAYDIACLLENITKNNPDLVSATSDTKVKFVSENNIKHEATNTNPFTNSIPSLVASKTGLTDLAGGNLAIVFDAGLAHPVAVVVLGSTEEGRFDDVMKLVDLSLEKLSK